MSLIVIWKQLVNCSHDSAIFTSLTSTATEIDWLYVAMWLTIHNFDIDIVRNNWVVVDTHADYSQVTIHSRQKSWARETQKKKNKWMNSAQNSEFFMTHSLMPSDSYYFFYASVHILHFFRLFFPSRMCWFPLSYIKLNSELPLLCNLMKLSYFS